MTTASSATGMSDVPAVMTTIFPLPGGGSFCLRVMVPAVGLKTAPGSLPLRAFCTSGPARVTRRFEPFRTISREILRIWLGRFPQSEDDLRRALPELPVVVDLGAIEVLIGVIPEMFEGLFGGQTMIIDLLQDVFETGFHPSILSQKREERESRPSSREGL